MASLFENTSWAKEFNRRVDETLGDDGLRVVFADQKKLMDELVVLSAYATKFRHEHPQSSDLDLSIAQRAFFLRLTRQLSKLQACVIADYFVFLEEAKIRMADCPEFKTVCASKLPPSNLIPHQFTQKVLRFAAACVIGEEVC